MPNYLPQEDTKLVTWIDRFLTLAKTYFNQLPLKAEKLESLKEAKTKLAAHQAARDSALERMLTARKAYDNAKDEYVRTEKELQTASATTGEAGVEARREAYALVEPLRFNPQDINIKQFLEMNEVPLVDDNRGDPNSDILPRTPEEFTVTPQKGGVNWVRWRANGLPNTNYRICYAVGTVHRGQPLDPRVWHSDPIIVSDNAQYRKGDYIEFPHSTRAQRGAPCWYRIVAEYHEKISPSTDVYKVECK